MERIPLLQLTGEMGGVVGGGGGGARRQTEIKSYQTLKQPLLTKAPQARFPFACNQIPTTTTQMSEGPVRRRNAGQVGVCLGMWISGRAHRPAEQRLRDKETLAP